MSSRTAPAPQVRTRLRVLPGGSSRPARAGLWLLFTVAVVVTFFALIYSRVALDRSAFDLQQLSERIAEEQERHWELRFQVAQMQSPERITALAEDMGMVYPDVRETVNVAGVAAAQDDRDERWASLKALLSAQP